MIPDLGVVTYFVSKLGTSVPILVITPGQKTDDKEVHEPSGPCPTDLTRGPFLFYDEARSTPQCYLSIGELDRVQSLPPRSSPVMILCRPLEPNDLSFSSFVPLSYAESPGATLSFPPRGDERHEVQGSRGGER